jgi:hypothetical protein
MLRILYLLALLVLPMLTDAAPRKSGKQRRPPPKVILVMLSTETNRENALLKAGRTKDLEILKHDREMIQKLTKADFKEHFNYCPAYFFYDTDLEAVKKKQFDGVLFGADSGMAPADAVTDTNFLIVYYGFPTWQTGRNSMEITTQGTVGGKPNGWGFVLNNHEMKQVGYIYWLRTIFLSRAYLKAFGYESDKFDIEYMPLAEDLNSKLYNYSGKTMQKNGAQPKCDDYEMDNSFQHRKRY